MAHKVETLPNTMTRLEKLQRASRIIWFMTGALEIFIALRVLLKFIGANEAAPFAQLIYNTSYLFLWPFANLTPAPSAGGMILETSSLIAMIIYALLAAGIIKVMYLVFADEDEIALTE